MQRILSTMVTSRKVRFTPANENSSVLFDDRTLTTLVIMSTKGGSAHMCKSKRNIAK